MNEQPSSGIARNYSCARIGVSAYPAQMAHSAATKLTSGMSGEIVLQRAGYGCIDHLARHEHAARTGDAEGIHQIRVAVRRWRATLSALAPFMPQAPRRSASNELRWIADALGEARNLDVFASALLAPALAALPWSSELERLAMAIDCRRQTAHAAARTALDSARYRTSVRALVHWVDRREWRAGADAATLCRPIGELAPILLSRRHRQAKKHGKSFARQAEEERHRLRLTLKKLRYTAELLGNLYEPATIMEFIRHLKQLLDDLGEINDVWVARNIVASLADLHAPPTEIDDAGRRIIAWHKRRLAGNEAMLRERLRRFLKTEHFWARPLRSSDLDHSGTSLPESI